MSKTNSILFSFAFRPLFLCAAVFGIISIGWWVIIYILEIGLPPIATDPVSWHGHEMLFGFVGAAIGGFLLTAVASWTQRPAVKDWRLMILTVAWLTGRVAFSLSSVIGPLLTALFDLSYPVLLFLFFTNEVVQAGDRRNYKVAIFLALFAFFNLLYQFEYTFFISILPKTSLRGGIMVTLLLVTTIAGRIIPNFTRNWLLKNRPDYHKTPTPLNLFDKVVMVITLSFAVCWVLIPYHPLTNYGAILTAILHLARLSRWCGWATRSDSFILVLHMGYLWIPLSLLLIGLSHLTGQIMFSASLHGLTIGTLLLLIVAVGSRAALGHSGRELKAFGAMPVSYYLISVSAIFRILATWPAFHLEFLVLSAVALILALLIFTYHYFPILTQPPQSK